MDLFGRIAFASATLALAAIMRAMKKPDGSLEANRVNVGRGEVVPQ